MKELKFRMTVEVEEATGEILAVYFQIRRGKAAKVREFANGNAYANYAMGGQLLGIELLGPCEITVLDKIAGRDRKVKEFVKRSIPRKMALAVS